MCVCVDMCRREGKGEGVEVGKGVSVTTCTCTVLAGWGIYRNPWNMQVNHCVHLTLSGNIQQKEEQNPLYLGWVSGSHTALPAQVEGLSQTC